MIIFYQIPDDETAVRLRKIIEEDKIEHMYVEKEVAGQTIGALFAGDLTETHITTQPCQSTRQLSLMQRIPLKKKPLHCSISSIKITLCSVIQFMRTTAS